MKQIEHKINKYLLAAILFAFLFFIFHYIEIFAIYNRESYFSDSENYFKASSKFPPAEYDAYYFVYILSFLRSIFSYKGAIIIFFVSYILLILSLFRKFHLFKHNLLFLFHPFIIFIFARGLKESMIMILFLVFMSFFDFNKHRYLNNFLIVIVFSFIFFGLKPMGEYFILVGLIMTTIASRITTTRQLLKVGIIFLIVSPLLRNLAIELIPNLKNQVDVLVLSGYSVEYTNNFLKPVIAFFFGPGPVKSLLSFFQNTYEFGTFMTSIALLTGSIISIILAFVILKNIKTIRNSNWNNFLIIITIIHVFTYILIQDGSVDTRQRGLMFFYLGLLNWK